jgi:hypothetical protein
MPKRKPMSVYETSFMVIDVWLPKIYYDSRCITARTCFMLQLVSFFSMKRKIQIDTTTRKVTISTRKWWVVNTTETIPFASIRHIDISEMTVGTEPGYTPDGLGWRDQKENFIPYIMTVDGRKIDLLSFYGEGSVLSGWWGILLGDQIIDYKGRQEKRSREFAERIATMVGVPCGVDSKIVADTRSTAGKIKCSSCEHFNGGSHEKCLYCGANIQRVYPDTLEQPNYKKPEKVEVHFSEMQADKYTIVSTHQNGDKE